MRRGQRRTDPEPRAARREQVARDVLARWVDGVGRSPGWILLGALIFTAACGVLAALRLGVDTDTEALFDDALPFRIQDARLDQAFPMLEDPILVVLDAPTPARAADAADALARRLAAEPDLYRHVYAPGSGAFYQRNGLLFMELDDLEDLVDRLAAAQPFLASFARDPGLVGFLDLVTEAVTRADDATRSGIDLADVLERVQEAVRGASVLEVRPLVFEDLVVGGARPGGGARRYVIVQPRIDYTELLPALAGLERVRSIARELGLGPGSAVRVRITGNQALSTEELEVVSRQSGMAGLASFVAVTLLLGLALRSTRLVIATSLTLAAGLVWTAGFATLAIGKLNLISVGFAVLFIGLGVDFGIHFCLRYRELRREGVPHADALSETARGVGASLALCALTTAIGFFAFLPTGYRGVAELGLIAGTGMFLSLVASLTLIPAILSVGRAPHIPTGSSSSTLGSAVSFPSRQPRAVLITTAVLAVAAALVAPQLRFDPNPLRVRDPGTESVRVFDELLAAGDVNPWSAEVLGADRGAAEILASRLEALTEVERVVTLDRFVPSDQETKRAVLAEASDFLNLPAKQTLPWTSAEAAERSLRALGTALTGFAAGAADARLRDRARQLAHAIDDYLATHGNDSVDTLEAALVVPLRDGIDDLVRMLEPDRVNAGTLPAEIRERFLAADGRTRVQVFPAEDLNDERALARFVASVRHVAPEATGDSIYMFESGRLIQLSLIQAFGTAALLVTIVLWLLWGSVRDTLTVLAPLGLAALAIAAVAVQVGMSLNFANVIVLPLLLGIGVDSGIHMVHRHRSGGHADLLATSTPRAVAWSALTTIASFGSLAFSTHRGMASLGQLLALGLALTLICNLCVLPALLKIRKRAD